MRLPCRKSSFLLKTRIICNIKPPPLASSNQSSSQSTDHGKIRVGQRNGYLTRKAVEFVECVDSESELLDELKAVREYDCDDLESIPDSELIGIASWAWQLRAENRIFAERNSGVLIMRSTADKLLSTPNGEKAFALFFILKAAHGHVPGKRFGLDPIAMKRDGLIPFGRDAFRNARNLLIDQGLLQSIGGYKRDGFAQQYQLTRLVR